MPTTNSDRDIMSKAANSKKKTTSKRAPKRKLGRPMKGSEIFVGALEREGVDTIFA